MLIIGSTALKNILPDYREPADLDLIVSHDKVNEVAAQYGEIKSRSEYFATVNQSENKKKVEMFIATPGNAMWMYLEKYNAFDGTHYMDLAGLYSLKKSHIHIPLKFEKHIRDYCFLNKAVGGKDIMPEITKQNNHDIKTRLNKKFKSPSLNKSVKDFFAQSEDLVPSWFIHDDIHSVMAHYDRPLYERMQKDLSQAWCEKDMWDQLSFEDKCKCVLEEAYVIALERKIIPVIYGGVKEFFSPLAALNWAMMRVCTTLTSGWFRKFSTDNFIEIMDKFADKNYAKKFFKKVDSGEIKFKEHVQKMEMA